MMHQQAYQPHHKNEGKWWYKESIGMCGLPMVYSAKILYPRRRIQDFCRAYYRLTTHAYEEVHI